MYNEYKFFIKYLIIVIFSQFMVYLYIFLTVFFENQKIFISPIFFFRGYSFVVINKKYLFNPRPHIFSSITFKTSYFYVLYLDWWTICINFAGVICIKAHFLNWIWILSCLNSIYVLKNYIHTWYIIPVFIFSCSSVLMFLLYFFI